MKTKLIIKFDNLIHQKDAFMFKNELLYQWNNDEAILIPPHIEIQAIILEDEKGEIKVINLKDGSTKNRKNILEKIKKLFKKKNKA